MRCFIAVELSEQVKKEIEKACARLPKGLRPVEQKNMHVTLKFLGEITEGKAQEAAEELKACARKKFSIKCKGTGVFPSSAFVRVLWAGVESKELNELAECVNGALSKIGFDKEKFTAHATIARARERIDITNFLNEFKDFDFGETLVSEVALKKSTLTPQGPEYEDIFKLKLR